MPSIQTIEKEIENLASLAGGTVGVCALHIESNQKLTLNASESFPMASTYKIAMAARLLQLVEAGELTPDQMIELAPHDLSPGSGMITSHLHHPGLSLSVYNLLDIMMTLSDNTATDLVLNLVGGGAAVTQWLHHNGIDNMRIDRSTKTLLCDAFDISEPHGEWSLQYFQDQMKEATTEAQQTAARAFSKDLQDTSTPDAMVSLLVQIFRNELLQEEQTTLLIDIMQRCQTGIKRIKGLLPPETLVAHKTGSIGRIAVNDAGFITLPNDAGHIAMAIFTKSSEDEDFIKVATCEQAIAHITRTIYDYFLFTQ